MIDSEPTFLPAKVTLPDRPSVSPLIWFDFDMVRMLAEAVFVPL